MEQIVHKNLKVNGINMHVAEVGQGPAAVLFLHGFPELWYSWRHQMVDLSSKGYRTIAPDLRGYGDTDAPKSPSSYTVFHIVGDLVALLDTLELEQVFLVGHDWGSIIAWWLCLIRPDRIKALVNTSVVFLPRNPLVKTIQGFRDSLGDGFYMCRFQEEEKAEEAFASVETAKVITTFLSSKNLNPPCIPEDMSLGVLFMNPPPLPSWLTQQDIDYYAAKFDKTGFTGGLHYYRAMDLSWELTVAWTGAQVKVPVKFVVGDLDLAYHFPGVKEFIEGVDSRNVSLFSNQLWCWKELAIFLPKKSPMKSANTFSISYPPSNYLRLLFMLISSSAISMFE